MFFESTRWPGETHVARALFAGPLDKDPSAHVFYESHVPWLEVNDDLPKKSSSSGVVQTQASADSPSDTDAEASDA